MPADSSYTAFMKTTIQLEDKLLEEAKAFAAETGRSLGAVIEDALRMALAQQKERKRGKAVKINTFTGKGVQPGVDLTSNAALEDFMGEYDGRLGR
jgi:hypothetical protein